jgi:hypothetical protein
MIAQAADRGPSGASSASVEAVGSTLARDRRVGAALTRAGTQTRPALLGA